MEIPVEIVTNAVEKPGWALPPCFLRQPAAFLSIDLT